MQIKKEEENITRNERNARFKKGKDEVEMNRKIGRNRTTNQETRGVVQGDCKRKIQK